MDPSIGVTVDGAVTVPSQPTAADDHEVQSQSQSTDVHATPEVIQSEDSLTSASDDTPLINPAATACESNAGDPAAPVTDSVDALIESRLTAADSLTYPEFVQAEPSDVVGSDSQPLMESVGNASSAPEDVSDGNTDGTDAASDEAVTTTDSEVPQIVQTQLSGSIASDDTSFVTPAITDSDTNTVDTTHDQHGDTTNDHSTEDQLQPQIASIDTTTEAEPESPEFIQTESSPVAASDSTPLITPAIAASELNYIHSADDSDDSEQKDSAALEPEPSPVSVSSSISPLPSIPPPSFDALRRWLHCIAVITFDLELGPSLEYCYPPDSLSQSAVTNVCALAFPDSHCHIIGDLSFCFRMRSQSLSQSQSASASESLTDLPSKSDRSSVRFAQSSDSFFGFVCFRQQRDDNNSRGYFQKSVVILTHLPCVNLFERMVSMIGSGYHQYGASIVESAAESISAWPRPKPGRKIQLPLLGKLLVEPMPHYHQLSPTHRPSSTDANGIASKVFSFDKEGSSTPSPALTPPQSQPSTPMTLSSLFTSLHSTNGWFQSLNLYTIFHSHVHNLWVLWELVITGEPVLVCARTPACVSEAVLGLVSLIAPVTYTGDYRPYYTIYDADFKYYTTLHDSYSSDSLQSLPAMIIGVTNTYFFKCWKNFPHILTLGECVSESGKSTASNDTDGDTVTKRAVSPPPTSPRTTHKVHRSFDTDESHISESRLISRQIPTLLPDEAILKKLMLPSAASSKSPRSSAASTNTGHLEINNALLRKYFYDLTDTFLRPFQLYLVFDPAVQMEYSQNDRWNPYEKWPELIKFDQKAFLKSLDVESLTGGGGSGSGSGGAGHTRSASVSGNMTPLTLNANPMNRRSKLQSLYQRFLSSSHFVLWFHSSRTNAQAHINATIFARIKRLASEPEAVFTKFLQSIKLANELVLAFTERAWYYMELAVQDEHAMDLQLVSAIFLHLSLIRRAARPSQLHLIAEIEKRKQNLIAKFATKSSANPGASAINRQTSK